MEWISVKDKLPELTQRVLVFKVDVALICFGVCFYNGRGRFLFDATLLPMGLKMEAVSDMPIKGITHWLPIPNHPYKTPHV